MAIIFFFHETHLIEGRIFFTWLRYRSPFSCKQKNSKRSIFFFLGFLPLKKKFFEDENVIQSFFTNAQKRPTLSTLPSSKWNCFILSWWSVELFYLIPDLAIVVLELRTCTKALLLQNGTNLAILREALMQKNSFSDHACGVSTSFTNLAIKFGPVDLSCTVSDLEWACARSTRRIARDLNVGERLLNFCGCLSVPRPVTSASTTAKNLRTTIPFTSTIRL